MDCRESSKSCFISKRRTEATALVESHGINHLNTVVACLENDMFTRIQFHTSSIAVTKRHLEQISNIKKGFILLLLYPCLCTETRGKGLVFATLRALTIYVV